MKLVNKIFSVVLVLLLLVTVYGLIRTGRESGIPGSGTAVPTGSAAATPVDQTPLLTAQALASMPTSAVELPFARQALQLGDQEMDLAFALAVLDATQHPPALTAKAKEIQARLQKSEDALAADQTHVAQLTAAEAKASGAQKNKLDGQLKLAQAQLELDQDEVDDAKEELIRAGGGLQDRIQAMSQEHEAASKASDAIKVAVSAPVEPHGLIQRFQQWSELHRKQLQLWRAKQEAISAAAVLALKDNSLERQLGAQATGAQNDASTGPGVAAPPPSAPVAAGKSGAPSSASSGAPTGESSATILETTQRRASDRKTLATLAKRTDNETLLANTYGQWIGVVAAEQRSLVNGALRGVLVILAIIIIAVLIDYAIGAIIRKTSMDRRQVATLRTVTRVTLQIVVVLLILLVTFGRPTQLGTFLGLAGAGLTVALKDFIIAFFGWFVLMGKNGVRLGDWVEINGVTGEVVELGMFHTVLLETGNWTDSGHPTGRRVTFTNGFAVEGHYFNFSTSGQWLWDELQIVLPAGQNPYPVVEAIQKIVLEATSEGARQAEQEWKSAAKSRDMKVSAAPAINVKPIVGGVEISVRYVTRANERSLLRAKLNHAAVDLLGSRPDSGPVSGPDVVHQAVPPDEKSADQALVPQPDSDSPKPALTSKSR
jgi:small-conductance mechanosensitive channel